MQGIMHCPLTMCIMAACEDAAHAACPDPTYVGRGAVELPLSRTNLSVRGAGCGFVEYGTCERLTKLSKCDMADTHIAHAAWRHLPVVGGQCNIRICSLFSQDQSQALEICKQHQMSKTLACMSGVVSPGGLN